MLFSVILFLATGWSSALAPPLVKKETFRKCRNVAFVKDQRFEIGSPRNRNWPRTLFSLQAHSIGDTEQQKVSTTSSTSALDDDDDDKDLRIASAKLELLENVVRQMKIKADQRESEYKDMLDKTALLSRDEAQKSVQNLQQEWDQARARWTEQEYQYEIDLEQLTQEYERFKIKAVEELEIHKVTEARLQQRIDSMKNEIASLHSTFGTMKQEIAVLTEDLQRQRTDSKIAIDAERSKIIKVNEELVAIRKARDDALEHVKVLKRARNTDGEAVEIAKASVAAAERRESQVRAKYDGLRSDLRSLQGEKEVLQARIAFLETENGSLKKKLEEVLTASKVSEIETKLRKEVDELHEQISALKMTHAAKLRAEHREAEQKIAEAKENYYKLIQQFRKTAMGSTVEPTQSRGLWQRIRRKFRRGKQLE